MNTPTVSSAIPNILVVDDTPANLQVLSSILQKQGYKARPLRSGELALRAAEAQVPDLALLDITMPGMDGYELCARLKRHPKLAEVPVIFVTAHQDVSDKVRGFNAGAVDYITKPFNFEEVEVRVRTHLELACLRRAQAHQVAQLEAAVVVRTRELAEAKDRLAILDRAKSDFLNLISHELRTPLHGLLGATELLAGSCADPHADSYKAIYEQSRDRLMTLVDDALLLTQIGVGSGASAGSVSPLDELLRAARAGALPFADSQNVPLAPAPTGFGRVQGVAEDLVRALRSLLETAVKFSPAASPVRLIGSVQADAVLVSIETVGRTAPPALLPHFFDLLAVAEPLPCGDLGLGPALAERIVSLYGGRMSVENLAPPGLRLVVQLKRVPGDLQPGVTA